MPRPSPETPSNHEPIVFSLTASERGIFFPDGVEPYTASAVWVDPEETSAAEWERTLRKLAPRVVVSCWSTPKLQAAQTTVDGGPVDYLCQASGSVRHVVPRELVEGGLKVTNWGTLAAPVVAEHAVLLALSGLRNLGAWRDFIADPTERSKGDTSALQTRTLLGRRVAIQGFGSITRELIRLLAPFGAAEVRVFSNSVPDEEIRATGAEPVEALEALADGAEVFFCCAALTERTRGLIDRAILERLAPGAVFVNIARGAIVNEDDLLAVARERGLRIASDVFCDEPLSADSPFFQFPGAVVSPHIGGPTHDFFQVCGRHALENITRYFDGAPLERLVTLKIFDRST